MTYTVLAGTETLLNHQPSLRRIDIALGELNWLLKHTCLGMQIQLWIRVYIL